MTLGGKTEAKETLSNVNATDEALVRCDISGETKRRAVGLVTVGHDRT